MRKICCDLCKKEIKEPVHCKEAQFKDDKGHRLDLTLEAGAEEMCEPCRNRIIRKIVKENFPLEK